MDKPVIHSSDHLPIGSDPIRDLRRFYVEPISPALTPDDYNAGDDLYTVWLNGWGNISSDRPASSYSLEIGGRPRVIVAATGGETVIDTVMFVMPEAFWPLTKERHFMSCGASGESVAVIDVYEDGSVVFLRQVAPE
jgi:hypothetical protein